MWLDDGDRSSVLGLLEMPKAQVSPLRPSRSLSTCDDRNLDVNINNSISFNDDELVHWSKHGLNWKPSTSTDATGGVFMGRLGWRPWGMEGKFWRPLGPVWFDQRV